MAAAWALVRVPLGLSLSAAVPLMTPAATAHCRADA